MYKFLLIALSLSLWKCEKPAPQKPKVISTVSYIDTINYDSIAKTKVVKVDSLKVDSIITDSLNLPQTSPVQSISVTSTDTLNTVQYSNFAKQNLKVKYENGDSLNYVRIIFAEKDINTILKETSFESETYKNDSIKWETKYKRRSGKLTINGTWFDFLIVE